MSSSLRLAVLLGLLALCCSSRAAPAQASQPAPQPEALVAAYKADVFALASDAMAGRASGSEGGARAIAYIEQRMQAIGLRPFAGDSLRQAFAARSPIVPQAGPETTCRIADGTGGDGKPVAWRCGREFVPFPFSADGIAAAPVVFAGHALQIPAAGIDDFVGVDVRGKIVLALRGGPRWREADAAVRAHKESLTFAAKAANAQALGAAALWIVDREDPGEPPFDLAQVSRATGSAQIPVVFVERRAVAPWLANAGGLSAVQNALDRGRRVEAHLNVRADCKIVMTQPGPLAVANVLGQVPGSGALGHELVLVGAHHDHIGDGTLGSLGGPEAAGKVHPGADDNASGVAGLLELARRAKARASNERTIVFAAFDAEELGQQGSAWFLAHLATPRDLVAMVDLNMIGRGRSSRLFVYGASTGQGLDELLRAAAAATSLPFDRRDRSSYRSDQGVFLAAAIPSLLFTTGLHEQYHRPTDAPALVELDAAVRILDGIDQVVRDLATGPRHAFVPDSSR